MVCSTKRCLTIVNQRTGLEIEKVNNGIFCSMSKTERLQSNDQTTSKVSSKMMEEASSSVAEDAVFGVHLATKDEVFYFICTLDAIVEATLFCHTESFFRPTLIRV